jgi:hypothetical protein
VAERKSTRGDIAIIVVALSVGFIFAGGGFLTAVLNTFNLEFVYPRSFSLVYFFAPVGMFVGFTTGIAFHELGHACMAWSEAGENKMDGLIFRHSLDI